MLSMQVVMNDIELVQNAYDVFSDWKTEQRFVLFVPSFVSK